MITSKRISLVCVIVTVLALVFTVLFMNGEKLGITAVIDDDTESDSFFSSNELNGGWEVSNSTHITLEGESATVSGNGAYYYEGDVIITNAGYYIVTGTLDNGSLIVDSTGSSKVWIRLNGVAINAEDDAALRVDQAKKVFLTLAEGTSNRLSSGSSLSDAAAADGTDGVIYAHDNLCINGSGTLDIDAGYMHGIVAKDSLIIAGGTLNIRSSSDGLRANDSLRITEANIRVTSGDDAVTINDEAGYLYIASGNISLKAEDDGVNAMGNVTIDGGNITVSAGDDGIRSDKSVEINNGTILMEKCYEGIEAVTVTMNDGDVTIYPSDDGINANGGNSGFFGGFTGFDGRGDRADGAGDRSEPPEGFNPGEDGSFELPEGFNPGEDGSSGLPEGFKPGQNSASGTDGTSDASADTSAGADGETYVRINGGKLTIINSIAQDADGIDSNGSIYITGGDVRISLPGEGTNSAIDYASESNGVCEISGGTVVACGSYMMAEGFDSSSTQCSILYNISKGAGEGSTLSLEDASGNVLLSWEVPAGFTSANISCPEMTVGSTLTVRIGDSAEEITLDEVSSAFGDVQSGGFGGHMNFGGMKPEK